MCRTPPGGTVIDPLQRTAYQSRAMPGAGPFSVQAKSTIESVRTNAGLPMKDGDPKYAPETLPEPNAAAGIVTKVGVRRPGPGAYVTAAPRARNPSSIETGWTPGPLYPPSRASAASVPIRAMDFTAPASGSSS